MRKHKNFGEHTPRATGGGQDVQCNDSKAQSKAKSYMCVNKKAKKAKAKASPVKVGGSRAGT